MDNLAAHIQIVKQYGLPCVVAINRMPTDTERELDAIDGLACELGADECAVSDGYLRGGEGAVPLAHAVMRAVERPSRFHPLYAPGTPVEEQIGVLARTLYGAADVELLPDCRRRLAWLHEHGLGTLPVCMAKSQLSLSHDPSLKGRPRGFVMPVRDVSPSVGAGFVVALCGDVQLLPGLGREPAYKRWDIDAEGRVVGLF